MIRSKLQITTTIIASVVLAACSDTMATAPKTQTVGPPSVVSVPRSGALHLVAECSQYTGLADSFCTITSSNVRAITVGSRVVYLQPAGTTSLDSDIVLVVGPGNYALGHVTLDFAAGAGTVTIRGGTGHFTSFHAKATVSALGGPEWAWVGTYRFGGHED